MHALARIPLQAILHFFHCKVMLGKFVYMLLKCAYRAFLNNLTLKLGQNNIEVSFEYYSSVPYSRKFLLVQIFAYLAKKPTE